MKNEFTKKLISLVFPIALQQFMLALVSASDALMLGMCSYYMIGKSVNGSTIAGIFCAGGIPAL